MSSPLHSAPSGGTSLDVLAPYLPYGIEVETTYENGILFEKGSRLPLTGLNTLEDFPVLAGEASFVFDGVLPVLRDFSQLVLPLADKSSVWVVELAKALTYYPDPAEDSEHAQPDWTTAGFFDTGNGVEVFWDEVEPNDGEMYDFKFTISPDWSGHWDSEDGPIAAGPLMVDWLRRHHFAVGLQPHQYVILVPAAPAPEAAEGRGGNG